MLHLSVGFLGDRAPFAVSLALDRLLLRLRWRRINRSGCGPPFTVDRPASPALAVRLGRSLAHSLSKVVRGGELSSRVGRGSKHLT